MNRRIRSILPFTLKEANERRSSRVLRHRRSRRSELFRFLLFEHRNYDVTPTVANVSSRDLDEVGQLCLNTASGERPELRGLERIHVPVHNRPYSSTGGNAKQRSRVSISGGQPTIDWTANHFVPTSTALDFTCFGPRNRVQHRVKRRLRVQIRIERQRPPEGSSTPPAR